MAEERLSLGEAAAGLAAEMITGDALRLPQIAAEQRLPLIDYVLTSPPYWDMLHAAGFETQKKRRLASDLDVIYSDDPDDLGNLRDYDEFLERLAAIYRGLKPYLRDGAYLTIIVKNVKKGGKLYPLAWDLAARLGQIPIRSKMRRSGARITSAWRRTGWATPG